MRLHILIVLALVVSASQAIASSPTARARAGATRSAAYNKAVANFETKPTQEIVNGVPARSGEFPWQVSLGVSFIPDAHWAHFCGGVIYKLTWIITAAHCVVSLGKGDLTIAAGVLKLSNETPRYEVDRQPILAPGYKPDETHDDLALLHLARPLPASTLIQPVSLITDSVEAVFVDRKTTLTASGWGANEPAGLTVSSLARVDLPFASEITCSGPLSYPADPITGKRRITKQMICAGDITGNGDTCQGDSGGPLVLFRDGSGVLVGITSWGGEVCAMPYKFGVYSRITQYRKWIEETTQP